jgi:hypothetical protein
MYRMAPFALLLPLVGCDQITNTYEGLTNPLVAQGIVLGVEAPESEQIPDLSAQGYGEGTGVTVFLADAESPDTIDQAPVEGAEVSIRPVQGSTPVPETGGGVYTLAPDPSLVYGPNQDWTIAAVVGDETGRATITLPPPPNVTVPEDHEQGAPITLDLSGQGFTAALVVVIDVQSGETTYSNQPEDIKSLYEFTRGNEEITTVEVPGTAFSGQSIYALGVAGMVHTTSEDIENMNSALSSVMGGKMRMFPVVTATMP